MLLSDAIDAFYASMDGVLAPKTVRWYRARLKSLPELLGDREIDQLRIDHLRAWRACLAHRATRWGGDSAHPIEDGGLSPYTLHQYVRGCRRLFKWLVEEGKLEISPAWRLELPKLPQQTRRGLSDLDRDRILEAALASGPRDYAICRLLADSACRVGGLVGLHLGDLDLDRRRAFVREKGNGGAGKVRTIYYKTGTRAAIERWMEARPKVKHDFLWVGRYNGPLSEFGVYVLLERLASTAGVQANWNPHNWRHGAIRGMLARGMSLATVSQIAGHSSVKTTGDLYGTFSEDELASQHDRYSWLE